MLFLLFGVSVNAPSGSAGISPTEMAAKMTALPAKGYQLKAEQFKAVRGELVKP